MQRRSLDLLMGGTKVPRYIPSQELSMRNFRDSSGSDWTVFEVRRQISAKGDWSYLPNGYSNGWLCFESATAKKRLTRYPERWREFSDDELEKLLGQAQVAPRSNLRLGDDLLSDRSSDARAVHSSRRRAPGSGSPTTTSSGSTRPTAASSTSSARCGRSSRSAITRTRTISK